MHFTSRITGATVVLCCGVALGQASFTGIGHLPGGTGESLVRGLSADGSVVVGFVYDGPTARPFRWDRSGGMVLLGSSAGNADDASADGSVIVGEALSGDSAWHAFRWTPLGGVVPVGGPDSRATSVSGDGSVVAGYGSFPPNGVQHVLLWTSSGQQDLGSFPGCRDNMPSGVSGDGTVVAGYYGSPGTRPFRWTAAGGLVDIGTRAGDTDGACGAVSQDGSAIAGWSGPYSQLGSHSHAVIWRSGAIQDLGELPGYTNCGASEINANGSAVVGNCQLLSVYRGWLWRPALGMVELNAYLSGLGLDLTGWEITEADGISADGSVIAGTGRHNGASEGWIAVIPHCGSADYNHDGDSGTDADIESFFACLAGNCCSTCDPSDFNGDGDTGTDADIEAFFRVLAGGSC
jgi:uncharacterized membrane protein